MNSIFRYGKSIAASLTVAVAALAANYGQHWMFPEVDPLSNDHSVAVDTVTANSESTSPMRDRVEGERLTWKVAVVTNRDHTSEGNTSAVSESSDTRTLAKQTIDAMFATAETTYGFADVQLPIVRPRGSCVLKEQSEHRVTVCPWRTQTEISFHAELGDALKESNQKDVFVFVHGFNVSLNQAVARAAQVSEDMPFHGVVVAFSWQSTGRARAYLTDEKLAERHFWSLAELLVGLRQNLDADTRIHLLAHSMGNRVALRALNALTGSISPTGSELDPLTAARLLQPSSTAIDDLNPSGVLNGLHAIPTRFPAWGSWHATKTSTPPLANLILAAPDVDAVEFTQFVGNIRHVSRKIVLYASDYDLALQASRKVHRGRFRAGESRANLNLEGVTTVRVSAVSSSDRLGHSYYGSNSQVLNQLNTLMRPPVRLTGSIGSFYE